MTAPEAARDIARLLRDSLAGAEPRLRGISEGQSAARRQEGAWSRKQVLGHLVDSAHNNLQRVVRATIGGDLVFPDYQQDAWSAAQAWDERPWVEIVDLFAALNRHLAHAIGRIPADRLSASCRIGDAAPVSLQFVARDYVRHLEHHLGQILEPEISLGRRYTSWPRDPSP